MRAARRRRIPQAFEGISMATQTGTVKWFNNDKGFGFIAQDDGGKDIFAHVSEIVGDGYKTLAESQRVEYDVGQGAKGPQATRIRSI
jgi:CspA family cold shock protein